MRRLAAASVVLGAAAVGCGLALLLLVAHGAHLQPPARRALWNAMWAEWLLPLTLVLAALAMLGARWATQRNRVAVVTARVLAVGGLALAVWPWLPRAAPRFPPQCLSNVKNLALAMQMYASDYGRFPPSERWGDATSGYAKSRDLYRCPDRPDIFGYAYNAALGGIGTDAISSPSGTPTIFESDRGWNAHGGKELLPDFPRHLGGDNLGFVDGHARWYARQKPRGGVRWDSVWPREYEKGSELQWQPALKEGAR